MKQSFDILNDIFDWCCADEELCALLEIDTSLTGLDQLKVQNDKLRREYQTADVIEHKDIPFISFYFIFRKLILLSKECFKCFISV